MLREYSTGTDASWSPLFVRAGAIVVERGGPLSHAAILARELGLSLDIGGFPVQNLIPEKLRDAPVDEFLSGLADYDTEMESQFIAAREQGKVLRYVATLNDKGEASVGLQMIPTDNPLANINLTDNIVQFVTDRYAQNPLVVQGPGAGPEVTAGGVFGDLLRLAAYLKGND